jgi:DNA-binding FadR family transcriptional regulator
VLARALGVSRNTVLAAYETLAGEGLTSGRAGSGTRVSHLAPGVQFLADASSACLVRLRESGFRVALDPFRDPDGHLLYIHP